MASFTEAREHPAQQLWDQVDRVHAGMLGIDRERISIKATTNERLGFVGRSEGIAAIATASVVYPGSVPP